MKTRTPVYLMLLAGCILIVSGCCTQQPPPPTNQGTRTSTYQENTTNVVSEKMILR